MSERTDAQTDAIRKIKQRDLTGRAGDNEDSGASWADDGETLNVWTLSRGKSRVYEVKRNGRWRET